jgi:hypothetical protein
MTIYQKQILWFDRHVTLACDGKCGKAWGLSNRPKIEFDPNEPDDVAWLADSELSDAPVQPGTWEGGHGKPRDPSQMNKWCARECERSGIFEPGEPIMLTDYSTRHYNQPWKHTEAT